MILFRKTHSLKPFGEMWAMQLENAVFVKNLAL